MEKKYLVVNIGSTSKKYALFEGEKEVCRVHIEQTGSTFLAGISVSGKKEDRSVSAEEYKNALEYISKIFIEKGFIQEKKDIHAIGMRVVAQGTYFQSHKIIDDEYIKKLDESREEVPLHVDKVFDEIQNIKQAFPESVIVGVSDTVFHKDMPMPSRVYALPQEIAEKYDIKRYGYHGISVQSIFAKLKKKLGTLPEKIVVCHLGGGGSITAIRDGVSVDTSMGFTPLEGLVTATRAGSIDPIAALCLHEKLGKNIGEFESFLNKECGLLGLSGKSGDIRDLIELEKQGDENAKLALSIFVHNIKKYIGAYMAEMNGLDLLVFSGTIGERSNIMRERICSDVESLGISINENKNNAAIGKDFFIQKWSSRVKVAVVLTDEISEIAKEIRKIA